MNDTDYEDIMVLKTVLDYSVDTRLLARLVVVRMKRLELTEEHRVRRACLERLLAETQVTP